MLIDILPSGGATSGPEWLDDAKCAQLPPAAADNLFHPTNSDYTLGKLYCQDCPVKRECAKLGASSKHGVFGGLSPEERKESAAPRPL